MRLEIFLLTGRKSPERNESVLYQETVVFSKAKAKLVAEQKVKEADTVPRVIYLYRGYYPL